MDIQNKKNVMPKIAVSLFFSTIPNVTMFVCLWQEYSSEEITPDVIATLKGDGQQYDYELSDDKIFRMLKVSDEKEQLLRVVD